MSTIPFNLVSVVGAAECGKDTFADYLVEHYDCLKYASGDPIKDVFARYYAVGQSKEWIEWACYTHEGKAARHPYLEGVFRLHDNSFVCVALPRQVITDDCVVRPMTNREVLEVLGDGMNRTDPEVLMRAMEQLHLETGKTVIDVATREEAQAEFVRSRGGVVVYLQRDVAEAKAGAHHTAQFYANTDHDFHIVNNFERFEDLYFEIERWITRQSVSRAA